MSISELNCHVKQAAKQEILTDVSKMSGYQIFHEEGCSVCCRATTCNLFHCFYFKAVNIFLNTKNRLRKYILISRMSIDAA